MRGLVCNWSKLVVLIGVISSAVYLGTGGLIEGEAVVGLLSACLGYVFGNGHAIVEQAGVVRHD